MRLLPGEPALGFTARTHANPTYAFDTAAGRYLVLCFAPADDASWQDAGRLIAAHRALFDDRRAAFFGVVSESQGAQVREEVPGIRWFHDAEQAIARLYGVDDEAGAWVLIDPSFRVFATAPFDRGGAMLASLQRLPPPEHHAGAPLPAPVLVVPRIFEPKLCADLIAAYDTGGGTRSGFMREVDGATVMLRDTQFKVRSDFQLPEDHPLREAVRERIKRRLAPQIMKAFSFDATRMERYIVACYAQGGFFQAHRDNTTKGTAHRRFAVTINLNAEAYDGGDLVFPEFGSRAYRAPTGGAVVFSCSLLHAAMPVTRGVRYAFLPFLYDQAAAELRERNLEYVSPELRGYKA